MPPDSASSVRPRSALFVPGNRPELLRKALSSGAETVIIDLEDAVPDTEKELARSTVAESVAQLDGNVPLFVRVNPVNSVWFVDDLSALAGTAVGIVLPKYEGGDDIGRPVIAGIETALGVADMRSSLGRDVVGCYFGAEDFVADLGGVRTDANLEVLHARSAVAIAARVHGIPALDMVTLEIRSTARFLREAREARSLGYAGKLCIHPSQVALANEAFLPATAEVDRARAIIAAYESAGRSAVNFEGTMLDEAIALQARQLLDRASFRTD